MLETAALPSMYTIPNSVNVYNSKFQIDGSAAVSKINFEAPDNDYIGRNM
jgi:hypothetical protein